MTTIKIKITKGLLDSIIEVYNKEYNESITIMDIKSLVLGLTIILNDKPLSWSSIKYYVL